jgi:hypothetical protein
MGAMPVAVLRVRDQERDALPDRCVLTGVSTTGAVRVWATRRPRPRWLYPWSKPLLVVLARLRRRPVRRVVLPVTDAAWRRLRRPLYGLSVLGGIGLAAIAVAVVRLSVAGVIAGAVLVAVALVARWRMLTRRWVQVWIRANGDEIVVANVSAEFADAARQLYLRTPPRPRR